MRAYLTAIGMALGLMAVGSAGAVRRLIAPLPHLNMTAA
jgi:hypothetical protein